MNRANRWVKAKAGLRATTAVKKWADSEKLQYNWDLQFGLVWISNGQKEIGWELVQILDGICVANTEWTFTKFLHKWGCNVRNG